MRIQLKNVGIIDKCDVEFVPGINLIVGSSGSGKSTLMRCIYNIATNEFSDSDISFGKNTMNVRVDSDDNIVEYSRSIKTKGERFYYTVNGETYTKVGRQSLPAVEQALKIGDIDINGDAINFNFNLQFSSPFLILGNQSTLYNVLTYRSTFDISSINDYYSNDIKNNASEIAANEKLKESLESNLESLIEQEAKLSPIEKLYSDYMSYKHKYELLNELKTLLTNIKQADNIKQRLVEYNTILKSVSSAINLISELKEMKSYSEKHKSYNDVSSKVKRYNKTISKYDSAINTVQVIIPLSKLNSSIKYLTSVNERLSVIDERLRSCDNILSEEQFSNDVIKQRSLLCIFNKCSKIIKTLNKIGNNDISQIEDCIFIANKLNSLNDVNKSITSTEKKISKIDKQTSQFKVCPLCGGHLDGCHKE